MFVNVSTGGGLYIKVQHASITYIKRGLCDFEEVYVSVPSPVIVMKIAQTASACAKTWSEEADVQASIYLGTSLHCATHFIASHPSSALSAKDRLWRWG